MRAVTLFVASTVALAACSSDSTSSNGGPTQTSDPACAELRVCCVQLANPKPCLALADAWEGNANAGDLCRAGLLPYHSTGACKGAAGSAGGSAGAGAGGSSGSSGAGGGGDAGTHAGGQGGNGGLLVNCKNGLTDCQGVCSDLNASVDHCGTCSTHCSPEETCDKGKCTALPKTCPCPVESYCELATSTCKSGCLADQDCSAGRYCDTGARTCKSGCQSSEDCDQAQNQMCGPASHQCECIPGTHACSGVCVTDTSPDHCGSLCTPCPVPSNGAATCDGQVCNSSCETGYHKCGDKCLSNTSADSCGSRCDPCPDNDPHGKGNCSSSHACEILCDTGYHLCSGTCVSNSEIAHCGTSCKPCPNSDPHGSAVCTQSGQCDMKCQQGYVRYQGACCLPTTCAAGDKNCGTISDGCGHNLTCGTCSGPDTCGGTGTPNVCGGGCTDDEHEPNNSESSQTMFEARQFEGYAYYTGTVCNNDEDYILARLVYQSSGCADGKVRELLFEIEQWPVDAQVTIAAYQGGTWTETLSHFTEDYFCLLYSDWGKACSANGMPTTCDPDEFHVHITANASGPVKYRLTAAACN